MATQQSTGSALRFVAAAGLDFTNTSIGYSRGSDKESKCQTASHYQPAAERSLRTAYQDGSHPENLWHLKGRP